MNRVNAVSAGLEHGRSRGLSILAKNWALFFLLLLVLVFSFTGEGFFSLVNFQNIIHLTTIFLLLSAAETYVIVTGGIDLSIGFVMGFSSVLSAKVMQVVHASGVSQPASILFGSLVGIGISFLPGLINGLLIARFRVPPFIATLGMWGITNGITLDICQGFPISFLPEKLTDLGNGFLIYVLPGRAFSFFHRPLGVQDAQIRELVRVFPNSLVFSLVVLFILWHVLKNSRFGQHTYAIGGSMDAAVRAGIDVRRHLIMVYTLSSLLAGLAGVFNVFQTGIGNFTPFNAMYELFAIAGVVIGGASLMGGKGSILGSCVGALLLRLIENGLSISGVEPFYRFIAVGLILILAVVIDQLFPELL